MVITHNLLAMNAQRQFNIVGTSKKKSTEKLSSGYKINRAADDAAGLTISEKMRSMIRGLNQGSKNTQDGISWIQVADGAMMEVHDMLHRMKELSVKAANGTNTDADREAINAEYKQLIKEIDSIDKHTQFNTKDVFLRGNVQLSVSGDPADLEVFDATYDSNNRLVTYGGLKFHGERIRWDEIDPGMVSTVDGKQVFNKGVYKFSGSEVDPDYYFEVVADDTTEVPYIRRNIELLANSDGIKIDGYQIPWSDIGVDPSNVAPGTYIAHYGNSELEIEIGDNEEIESINDIIESINSKNDGVFEYQWITTCIGVAGEKAVNMYSTNNPGGNYNKTEIVDADMAMNTKCNATSASDPASKLEYTIVIDRKGSEDPAVQTIYLEGSVGGKIAGSEKTLASLGITSWDSDSSIKPGKEYLYKDTSGTEVEFKFTLSDITSFDSVEDGLYKVKLGGKYTTSYDNEVKSSSSNVVVRDQSDFYKVSTFDQEIQLGRDFDKKNYEIQSDPFSYDSSSKTMKFSVDSVIPGKADLYTAILTTGSAQSKIENSLENDANEMYQWKLQQALNNESTHKTYNQSNQKTDLMIGGGSNWIKYGYDRNEYLNSLDNALNIQMVNNAMDSSVKKASEVSNDELKDYYVFDKIIGKYVNAQEYMEKMVRETVKEFSYIHEISDRTEKIYGASISSVTTANQWCLGSLELAGGEIAPAVDKDTANKNITVPINEMVLGIRENNFNSEEEGVDYVMGFLVPNGDYSNFKLTDKVDLYKVKVSFDETPVSFDNSSLDSKSEKIMGRLDTYPASNAILPDDVNDDIEETIKNYSEFVMKAISDASSYSVHKDAKDTTAEFSGDEYPNTAIRAYYNSDMLMTPIEKGILIQHSGIQDDYTIIPQVSINTSILGIRSQSLATELTSKAAIESVDNALAYVSDKRSLLGAYQNRLEHTYNNNENKAENLTAAESRIRDTDMATEAMNNTKLSILEQAITSMMAQANQSTQGVLSLLQ